MINTSQESGYKKIGSSGGSSLSVSISIVNLIISVVVGIILIATLSLTVYNAAQSTKKSTEKTVFPAIAAQYSLPSKYAVEHSVPRLLQLDRGTCWAFGTIGALEHSYRLNGIKKGFLKENEYVPFSLQAYGMSVVSECKNASDICEVLGDAVYVYPKDEGANTDGGEVSFLYYLKNLWKQIYPETICPYLPDSDQWNICPNLQDALDADNNPIRFTIQKLTTTYDVEDTKRLLYEQKQTLAISTPVHGNYFYIPCYNTTQQDPSPLCKEFNDTQKVQCPPWVHIAYANDDQTPVLCVKQDQPGYNMDGEWYIDEHVQYAVEGGHAMQIVGYNDHYRSFENDVGGFLIKNSWVDQSYLFNLSVGLGRGGRGSHSIDYLQMKISDWNERQICPNADSPLNWLSCTEVATGPTYANEQGLSRASKIGNRRHLTANPNTLNHLRKTYHRKHHSSPLSNANPAEQCLDASFRKHFVNLTKQPMQFRCRFEYDANNTIISNGTQRFGCLPDALYFLDWLEFDENGFVDANFIEYVPATNASSNFTLYTLPVAMLAEAFLPYEVYDDDPDFYKKNLLNSADECGYYFFPYSLLEKAARKSSSWFASHFDIEWADSSYPSQKSNNKNYDYTWLANATATQTQHKYGGPQPYTPDAQNPDHPDPDWIYHSRKEKKTKGGS